MNGAYLLFATDATTGPWPDPVQQAPFPPFPPPDPPDCPTCKIHTAWYQAMPPTDDPRWIRSNPFAVEIPGLPFVPGGSSNQPAQNRVLTGFFNRYPPAWQDQIILAHQQRNLRHFQLWTADALYGTYGATPQSLSDYAQQTLRLKQAGFHVEHNLLSKVTDKHDGTWADHRDHVQAIHDALTGIGAIDATDAVDVGWELDQWNVPGAPLQTIIDGVCETFAAVDCRTYVHFSANKTSWQTDGTSEEDWWRIQASKPHPITGIKWQADPAASIPLMQARFNDLLRLFARIGQINAMTHPFDPIPFELVATNQFDGSDWTEARGAMYGWCLGCTTWADDQPLGPIVPMGTGQGGNRTPDGYPF